MMNITKKDYDKIDWMYNVSLTNSEIEETDSVRGHAWGDCTAVSSCGAKVNFEWQITLDNVDDYKNYEIEVPTVSTLEVNFQVDGENVFPPDKIFVDESFHEHIIAFLEDPELAPGM